jgi:uncharacterized protein (TIGR01777 family)
MEALAFARKDRSNRDLDVIGISYMNRDHSAREGSGRTVVLAGGSGFLGQSLAAALLERGDGVVIQTRTPERAERARPGVKLVAWDGETQGDWSHALDGAFAVVNLAGRSVNCRYTEENRREIVQSRVGSVRAIAEAIRRAKRPPPVLVQAGSLAIYGDPGERECDDTAPAGSGFSSDTCVAWERAFDEEATGSTRRVLLRIGFVLGRDGGALEMLARLTRRFLGGAVGSGRQFMSWLHVRDMINIALWAIDRAEVSGVFNATGPNPVTNEAFMRELRRALGRPWSPPTPGWAVALGAWFMGTEPGLALEGRRCVPRRLLERRFAFEFPELGPALGDIFGAR